MLSQYHPRINWRDIPVTPSTTKAATSTPRPSVTELLEAARVFASRTDAFAAGKADICADLAAKLRKFGGYASEKQKGFAEKLVEWSKPRDRTEAAIAASNTLKCPDLFAVMQKHSILYVDPMRIARRNQDSLCWIMYGERCVGKIEKGEAVVFPRKAVDAGTSVKDMLTLLREFESNPLAAAMKYGKLAGRCCSCGRDLTNPESIEAGIGPICAGRFTL